MCVWGVYILPHKGQFRQHRRVNLGNPDFVKAPCSSPRTRQCTCTSDAMYKPINTSLISPAINHLNDLSKPRYQTGECCVTGRLSIHLPVAGVNMQLELSSDWQMVQEIYFYDHRNMYKQYGHPCTVCNTIEFHSTKKLQDLLASWWYLPLY